MNASGLQLDIAPERRFSVRRALPYALFAALALVAEDMLGLRLAPAPLLGGMALLALASLLPRRRTAALLLAAAAALLALLLWSAAREGAKELANALFDASEAVNRYAYARFAPSAAASVPAARILLSLLAAGLCGAAVSCGRRWPAALLAAPAFALEAYFGVVPAAGRNLALFFVLALLLAEGRAPLRASGAAVLLASSVLVLLAVAAVRPGVNAGLEAASEDARDRLSLVWQRQTEELRSAAAEAERVRKESRLRAAEADTAGDAAQEYEHQTRTRQEIALPERTDVWRIVLLALAILALLILPFLPFALLDARRRKAAARRADFASPDAAAAIRAMFPQLMRLLTAYGLPETNEDFSAAAPAVAALMPPDFAADYAAAVPLWQEAAYSGHAMGAEARETVAALLTHAERTVAENVPRLQRLRLKYVDCLL